MHTYNSCVDTLPWSEISEVTFIGMSWQKHAVRSQGGRDFEVWQDFEEIAVIFTLKPKECGVFFSVQHPLSIHYGVYALL